MSHDDSSEERRPARAEPTFWSTVQAAIADGWGATLRLSVIVAGIGAPTSISALIAFFN